MSEDFLENPYGILGLVIAVIIMIIVYFINLRIGKKKHLFDERYQQTSNRAKARSWDAMLVIYLAAWFVVIIFDGISFSFFLLTALYVLHNMTLMITGLYFSNKDL
ncbi:DUF2178 domain-containing protein [Virgibacillus indicus]|uniref:DUF2178 domain-containing protein n=1 Tax=Virgibacillus indicus TaxID=2024554 RepID=UPI001F0A3F9E|nr:DUF2178 domain-containing protein [Virgibacillus indicus]